MNTVAAPDKKIDKTVSHDEFEDAGLRREEREFMAAGRQLNDREKELLRKSGLKSPKIFV